MELQSALDNFERIHTEWVDNPNRVIPDATYWDGVIALLEVFDHGDMPELMKPFGEAIAKLDAALCEFDDRSDINNHMPKDGFWAAVEGIFNLRKQQKIAYRPKRLETIAELNQQDVPLWQIAKIYALVDECGKPDTEAVKAEIAKPGSVITPDWVHPDERERRRLVQQQDERRKTITAATQKKVSDAKPVCSETCENLWKQKVGVEQAAKMLRRSEDEIQDEYNAFNQRAQDEAAAEAAKKAGEGGEKSGRSK
jgi:hypothetical protein